MRRWQWLAAFGGGALMLIACGPFADTVDESFVPRWVNVCCRGTDSEQFAELAGGSVAEVSPDDGALAVRTYEVQVEAVAVTARLDPDVTFDISWEQGGGMVEPEDADEFILALVSLAGTTQAATSTAGPGPFEGFQVLAGDPATDTSHSRRFDMFGTDQFAGDGPQTVVLGVVAPVGSKVVLVAEEGRLDLRTGRAQRSGSG
jgi:hypothetical protein